MDDLSFEVERLRKALSKARARNRALSVHARLLRHALRNALSKGKFDGVGSVDVEWWRGVAEEEEPK